VADDLQTDPPAESVLFIRTDHPEAFAVRVNQTDITQQKPEYVNLLDRGNNLENAETVYAFLIPVSALKQGNNQVAITSQAGEFMTKRIEIALKYGDAKTHGYF
jgi:hypothetical protein